MTGAEFVRRMRRLGRERGVAVEFRAERGKGGHGTLYHGRRVTIVRSLKDDARFHWLLAVPRWSSRATTSPV